MLRNAWCIHCCMLHDVCRLACGPKPLQWRACLGTCCVCRLVCGPGPPQWRACSGHVLVCRRACGPEPPQWRACSGTWCCLGPFLPSGPLQWRACPVHVFVWGLSCPPRAAVLRAAMLAAHIMHGVCPLAWDHDVWSVSTSYTYCMFLCLCVRYLCASFLGIRIHMLPLWLASIYMSRSCRCFGLVLGRHAIVVCAYLPYLPPSRARVRLGALVQPAVLGCSHLWRVA